jgi:aminoglycoside/choline kinase family phosphotransferase
MEMPDAVRTELENVAALLEREPKALVHRDFQSTNVLWKGGALSFIDFQGMRLGPAAYDLASLVYDPYVTFTEGGRRALVALYAKKAERPELVKILPYAAVQRLVQCLGAYGRLESVGQPQFGKYVLPALENLLDAADKAGLDAVGALAEDLIAQSQRHHRHGENCHCHER